MENDTKMLILVMYGWYHELSLFLSSLRDYGHVDFDLVRYQGQRTYLGYAAENGHVETMRVLLRLTGARPDDIDFEYTEEYGVRTTCALNRAIAAGKPDAVKFLVEQGARATMSTDCGTPHGNAKDAEMMMLLS